MADHMADAPPSNTISVALTHQGTPHTIEVAQNATIADLALHVEVQLSIPITNQKYLVPKLGLLKPPFKDPELPVSKLDTSRPIKLMGTTASEVASMASASQAVSAREGAYAAQRRAQPNLYTAKTTVRSLGDKTYTFLDIRPLQGLPNPERSLDFLKRLAKDVGIVTAMKNHKFSVGLLTEMDPLSYTESNHEGTTRILGLNRNKGQAIELRLRTDAYDGYRDYKTIRKTLCHELAHNIHSDHDRQFWDLTHQIEKEVAKADYTSSGRSVAEGDFYEPSEEIAYDHGGWTGGAFVLGGGENSDTRAGSSNIRELRAKAAEERSKRLPQDEQRRSPEP